MDTCQTCQETKPYNRWQRFCLLYGITVRNEHPACKYYRGGKSEQKPLDGPETPGHDMHKKP